MKIAHVQVIPKMSGVQQISLDILCGLEKSGLEKYVICGENPTEQFVESFRNAGVEIIIVPSIKRNIGLDDLKSFIALYKVFKKYNFDIVHTNSTKPGIVARIAAKFAGINKIIHTVHGVAFHKYEVLPKRIFYYLLENFSTLFGDVNITVNKKYISYYPLVKSHLIYNGVSIQDYQCETKYFHNECGLHFAFLGRLDTQKNPLEFIEAVNLLVNKFHVNNNIRFTLAGNGELFSECKTLITNYNLEDKILMPGWITNKSVFFNDVDVLCQPSLWEAFGLVFTEAALFQIPSIAHGVEGIPEVVLDNITGQLYKNGPEELAEKMLYLINHPDEVKRLGNQARKHTLDTFTKERMVAEYSKVYFERK
ncbi:glycosyltransferase family 4 protein [Pantoea sp. B566]|uniref:glycosyltransferase family 4 protein n=1 Tax=Pantoea sp. B566 TaxID=2974030 RepID=UPI002166864E|nr:glycosyltransferase family 4 protein [Pantoea sp. B566]MCS3402382.1 glycosyltransferase family 4 protein [Pantoea sp. B566]